MTSDENRARAVVAVACPAQHAFLFRDAPKLAALWKRLLVDERTLLAEVRARLAAARRRTWHECWRERVSPMLDGMGSR